jgi:hypothetical protein
MTQKQIHRLIGLSSVIFAALCVELLPPLVVAVLLSGAVSVIGIAVEKERRRARGHCAQMRDLPVLPGQRVLPVGFGGRARRGRV